jgi:soluble lytic murein transglycosylase-like protein
VAIPPGFSPAFTPEVVRWSEEILRWSEQYKLPTEVIATVMQIESCGDPEAQSSAGAQGLFQVMPFHFSAGEQPTDPEVNARRGLAYLARSMELAGDDLAAGFGSWQRARGLSAPSGGRRRLSAPRAAGQDPGSRAGLFQPRCGPAEALVEPTLPPGNRWQPRGCSWRWL